MSSKVRDMISAEIERLQTLKTSTQALLSQQRMAVQTTKDLLDSINAELDECRAAFTCLGEVVS